MTDLNYRIEIDPDTMTFRGIFPDSHEVVEVRPHLCQVHDDNPDADHRGLIDITFYNKAMFGEVPVASWLMKPEMAAAMVEGLEKVIPLAVLNQQGD